MMRLECYYPRTASLVLPKKPVEVVARSQISAHKRNHDTPLITVSADKTVAAHDGEAPGEGRRLSMQKKVIGCCEDLPVSMAQRTH
jgi:hypothetical protein